MRSLFSFLTPSKNKSTPRRVQASNPRTPMSLPGWEAIQEPLSSPSNFRESTPTPTRLKRTIDELQDPSTPVTPTKKRAVTQTPAASSSRTRLDSFRAAAQAYKTPPVSTRNGLVTPRSSHVTIAENPTIHQAAPSQQRSTKQAVTIDLTGESGASDLEYHIPQASRPSAKALGKRKDNPTRRELGEQEVGNKAEVPERVRKKCKRAVEQPEPMSQGSAAATQARLAETRPAMPSINRPERVPATITNDVHEGRKRKTRSRNRNKNKNRKSQATDRNVAHQDPLPSPPPELSGSDTETLTDGEEDAWFARTAEELNLDRDHIQILRRIREEPDDKKFLYAIGWQMSRDSWEIPQESKQKLASLTTELLLSFKWPTPFKNRHFNIYRLLESIKSNPTRIGLDRSWIDEPLKFYALQSSLLLAFSQARHQIKAKIAESLVRKYTIEELAESLDKKDAGREDLGILALLRRRYLANRSDEYFDKVDKVLKRLHDKSTLEAKRKLDKYLEDDRKMFRRLEASESSTESTD